MKKMNKGILLVTTLVLLGCGGKGLPKQKAITAEEALEVALGIAYADLDSVTMPDEFYLSLKSSSTMKSTEGKNASELVTTQTIVLSYSKSKSISYYSLFETTVFDGQVTANQGIKQWIAPSGNQNEIVFYSEETSGSETQKDVRYDTGVFEDLIQVSFVNLNNQGLGILETFAYSEESPVPPEYNAAWETFYGSDNDESLQIEENYSCKLENQEPEPGIFINQKTTQSASCYIKDLIMLEARMLFNDYSELVDGSQTYQELDESTYKLEESSKKMPKLNEGDFPIGNLPD